MGRMAHLDSVTIAAYQDDGLPPSERERARAHLADCAACRDRLGAQVRAAAGREGLGASVAGAIGRSRSVAPIRQRELLAAAAVGALLLGGGLWLALDRGETAGRASRPPAEEVPAGPRAPASVPPAEELAGIPSGAAPESPRPAAEARPAEGADPELLALRGATRTAEGRTFRLQGEDWVDTGWRPSALDPPVEVRRGSVGYADLVAREPRVSAWSEIGPRVLVLVDSTAYRILP